MKKRLVRTSIFGLCFISLLGNSAEIIGENAELDIPYTLIKDENGSKISIDKNRVTILAKQGTDLYTNSDGSKSTDNAPRVYFEPKSDFIFSAKIKADFENAYDGGAIFIYENSDNWGKLLFERFKSGDNGVASTVTRSTGDDAYHNRHKGDEIYLKIVRKTNTFIFYNSSDGNNWSYLRSFGNISSGSVKLGFIAQSPISSVHSVVYSDIQFEEKTITDLWQGK